MPFFICLCLAGFLLPVSATLPSTPAYYELGFISAPSTLNCSSLGVIPCEDLLPVPTDPSYAGHPNVTRRVTFPATEDNWKTATAAAAALDPSADPPIFPREVVITLRPQGTTNTAARSGIAATANAPLLIGSPWVGSQHNFAFISGPYRTAWALWMREVGNAPGGAFVPATANSSVRTVAASQHGILVDGVVRVPRLVLEDCGSPIIPVMLGNVRAAVQRLALAGTALFLGPPTSLLTEAAAEETVKVGALLIGNAASASSLFNCLSPTLSGCADKTLGMRRFPGFVSVTYFAESLAQTSVSAVISASSSGTGNVQRAEKISLIQEDNTFGDACAGGVREAALRLGCEVSVDVRIAPTPNASMLTDVWRRILTWRNTTGTSVVPDIADDALVAGAVLDPQAVDAIALCVTDQPSCGVVLDAVTDGAVPRAVVLGESCGSVVPETHPGVPYVYFGLAWHGDARGSAYSVSVNDTIPLWPSEGAASPSSMVWSNAFEAETGAPVTDVVTRALAGLLVFHHALTVTGVDPSSAGGAAVVEAAIFAMDTPSVSGTLSFHKLGTLDGGGLAVQASPTGKRSVVAPLYEAASLPIYPAPPLLARLCLRADPPQCVHGSCSLTTGDCVCSSGWGGDRCDEEDAPFEFPWWAYVVIALVVAAAVVCFAVIAWRYYQQRRQFEDLFSAQVLAERTAEAIVDMRLEDLDYLFEGTSHGRKKAQGPGALRGGKVGDAEEEAGDREMEEEDTADQKMLGAVDAAGRRRGKADRLTAAFQNIVLNLRAYRPFIPQHLLVRESADDNDDDIAGGDVSARDDLSASTGTNIALPDRPLANSRRRHGPRGGSASGSVSSAGGRSDRTGGTRHVHTGRVGRFDAVGLQSTRATIVVLITGGSRPRPFDTVIDAVGDVPTPLRRHGSRGSSHGGTPRSRSSSIGRGASPRVRSYPDPVSRLVSISEAAATATNGTLTITSTGEVVVSYLAGICARREQRAAEFVSKVLANAASNRGGGSCVAAGIVSAIEQCGNVGTGHARAFVLGGGLIARATALASLAQSMGVGCLMNEDTVAPLLRVSVMARAAVLSSGVAAAHSMRFGTMMSVGAGSATVAPAMECAADAHAGETILRRLVPPVIMAADADDKTPVVLTPLGAVGQSMPNITLFPHCPKDLVVAPNATGCDLAFELVAVDERRDHEWMYEIGDAKSTAASEANEAIAALLRTGAVLALARGAASTLSNSDTASTEGTAGGPRAARPYEEAFRTAAARVGALPPSVAVVERPYSLAWAHELSRGPPPPPFVALSAALPVGPRVASILFGAGSGVMPATVGTRLRAVSVTSGDQCTME
eukprot:TRINITY_DN68162_c0_g1_i1.p1 TRINITY_DN68162_c0_g1~~TRINITY_DN68162_c0_g1_i1.p1  ORF type:complete len:1344 (+),score=258.08 TRINITY_DN68162_c0_g1_i1:35-4033(+)